MHIDVSNDGATTFATMPVQHNRNTFIEHGCIAFDDAVVTVFRTTDKVTDTGIATAIDSERAGDGLDDAMMISAVAQTTDGK